MWQFLDSKDFPSVTGDNIDESSLLNMLWTVPDVQKIRIT